MEQELEADTIDITLWLPQIEVQMHLLPASGE
jgi:hypothetical protein